MEKFQKFKEDLKVRDKNPRNVKENEKNEKVNIENIQFKEKKKIVKSTVSIFI